MKKIKKALIEDEHIYYQNDFGENLDLSSAWRTARVILGENNNLSPTVIKTACDNGDIEMVTTIQKD